MGLVVKTNYFHLREILTVESHIVRSGQVRSLSLTEVAYLRLRWCPSSSGSYTPGCPQSTCPRLARSEERNKYHPGTAILMTGVRQTSTRTVMISTWSSTLIDCMSFHSSMVWARSTMQRGTFTSPIYPEPDEPQRSELARPTILPGHAWKICRSQKWQKPTSCQRFRYMEAVIFIF